MKKIMTHRPHFFRRLGALIFSWRSAAKFVAPASRHTQEDILQRAHAVLAYLRDEKDDVSRNDILFNLESYLIDQLKKARKSHPRIVLNFETFYQDLMRGVNAVEKSERADKLIAMGLRVASAETTPSSKKFFDAVVQFLSFRWLNPLEEPLRYPSMVLEQVGSLARNNPDFITPEYVEMCCLYLSIPLRPPVPVPETRLAYPYLREAPHIERRRKRIADENSEISDVHDRAIGNIQRVLNIFSYRLVKIHPDVLFSEDSITALKSVRNQGVPRDPYAVVKGVLRSIEMLRTSHYPHRSEVLLETSSHLVKPRPSF